LAEEQFNDKVLPQVMHYDWYNCHYTGWIPSLQPIAEGGMAKICMIDIYLALIPPAARLFGIKKLGPIDNDLYFMGGWALFTVGFPWASRLVGINKPHLIAGE
jgi:hypothetical protein